MTFEKWFDEELRKYVEDRDMRAALERSKGSVELGWKACELIKNAELSTMNNLGNQAMMQMAEEIVVLRSKLLGFENQKPVDWSEITKMCNWFSSDRPKLYATPVEADLNGFKLVPVEPTEEEVDAPRCFLLGLELGHKSLESMRKHMRGCGEDISMWPDWAKTETGHITKAGKAIIIRSMMIAACES
jgi:hypothetical protein